MCAYLLSYEMKDGFVKLTYEVIRTNTGEKKFALTEEIFPDLTQL